MKVKKIKKMNYKIVAKYIKKLKFGIPNPDVFFLLTDNIKNYKINIDIKSSQVKNNLIEIETALNLKTYKSNGEKIEAEVSYSAIVELGTNTKKEDLKKIVLIDVPTKIYPTLRETFMSIFEKSGFKEIIVEEEIDFETLSKKQNIQ